MLRFDVFNTDINPTENPRAQLESEAFMSEGDDWYVGHSFLFPTDFPALPPGGWLTVSSIYGAPFNGTGPLGFGLIPSTGSGDMLALQSNAANPNAWLTPVVRNKWIDIVLRFKLSGDPAVGFVEISMNQGSGWVQQTLENGLTRMPRQTLDASNSTGPQSARINCYRKVDMFDEVVMYHGHHVVARTFAAAAPTTYGA